MGLVNRSAMFRLLVGYLIAIGPLPEHAAGYASHPSWVRASHLGEIMDGGPVDSR